MPYMNVYFCNLLDNPAVPPYYSNATFYNSAKSPEDDNFTSTAAMYKANTQYLSTFSQASDVDLSPGIRNKY